MGVIAYVRQIYLDADHYKLVKAAYDRDPRGMKRPEYDRALEGVMESKRILLPAERESRWTACCASRAELKQPVVLYGMREGYRARGSAEETQVAGAGEPEMAGKGARCGSG